MRREDLDGVKVYLGDIGWVMVRASGTEPMLRVYSETTRPGNHAPRSRRSCEIGPRAMICCGGKLLAVDLLECGVENAVEE